MKKILTLKNVISGKVENLKPQEILYIEISKNRLWITTQKSVYVPLKSIADFKKALENKGFEQLDQSNLVNISYVKSYDRRSGYVTLESGEKLHVSRRNEKKLRLLNVK